MLALFRLSPDELTGYTFAVDYWSLGVLIFVLVVGELPFPVNDDVVDFGQFIDVTDESGLPVHHPSYKSFLRKLDSLLFVSRTFKKMMVDLLTVDEKKRLGSGDGGIQNVKSHPWFEQNRFGSMPWSLLGKKLVRPPRGIDAGTPDGVCANEPYASFKDMCLDMGVGGLLDWAPNAQQQSLFDTWYVCS
jgi:serine/threonine protein kinase